MKKIYLECVKNRHRKFYEIELHNRNVSLHFGRIDRNGKKLNKIFHSDFEASNFFDKQLKAKLKKYSVATPRFYQLKFDF